MVASGSMLFEPCREDQTNDYVSAGGLCGPTRRTCHRGLFATRQIMERERGQKAPKPQRSSLEMAGGRERNCRWASSPTATVSKLAVFDASPGSRATQRSNRRKTPLPLFKEPKTLGRSPSLDQPDESIGRIWTKRPRDGTRLHLSTTENKEDKTSIELGKTQDLFMIIWNTIGCLARGPRMRTETMRTTPNILRDRDHGEREGLGSLHRYTP